MSWELLVKILVAGLAAGTTLLLAATGEIIAERSGVLNLGLEGMMLVGAVSAFAVDVHTSQPWLGAGAGILAAAALGVLYAILVVSFRTNQVVTGLALVIFASGLSGFLGEPLVGVAPPRVFERVAVPVLADIPLLGPVLFQQNALVYASFALVALTWWFLFRTRPGLNLRSVGESPATADAVGISVARTRYAAVIVGGGFAGLAGAYLSLALAPSWIPNMTAGRGWIAIALVIFATWSPVRAALGAYLFGSVEALGFRLQTIGIEVQPFFVSMMPYLFTIAVLVVISRESVKRRLAAPAALGHPYLREER